MTSERFRLTRHGLIEVLSENGNREASEKYADAVIAVIQEDQRDRDARLIESIAAGGSEEPYSAGVLDGLSRAATAIRCGR